MNKSCLYPVAGALSNVTLNYSKISLLLHVIIFIKDEST